MTTQMPKYSTAYTNTVDQRAVLRQYQTQKDKELRQHIINCHRKEYGGNCIVVVDSIIMPPKTVRWSIELTALQTEGKKEWLQGVVDTYFQHYDWDYGFIGDLYGRVSREEYKG